MAPSVDPQYLLEGSVFALEQCGVLLRDAALLYRSGSHASGVALAAFGREELGRWKILLDLRSEVLDGKTLTIDDVKARCEDHVTKQRAGMLSLTMRADRDTRAGQLIMSRIMSAPGSEEWAKTDAEIAGEIGSGIDSSEFAVDVHLLDLISSVICMYRRKDFTKSLRVGIEWATTQDLIWGNRDEALLFWTGGNANHVTGLC